MSKRGAIIAERIGELSAQIHAATAELVALAAEFDDDGTWAEIGVRSCAHWLSLNTGADLWTSGHLVRVGRALTKLPKIAGAFAAGRLSFDKVRALAAVATPEDEGVLLDIALKTSGAQLARVCRAVRRALDADDPRRADDALANRGVRVWWRDDGMLELIAVLPREDGAIVLAAVEAAASAIAQERNRLAVRDAVAEPALTLRTARADAITRVCDEWVASVSTRPTPAPTRQMVVHVDARLLKGDDGTGRCHIEDGPWISKRAMEWLACDSDVVTVVESNGSPVGIGATNRLISPRKRLAMQARDKGCRYPGCSVPPPRTEGHHIRHWKDGGSTVMENLLSLCRFHHRRHHEGKFEIRIDSSGEAHFYAADGTPLCPVFAKTPEEALSFRAGITADAARAIMYGEPLDFPYAVSVIADSCRFKRRQPP